MSQKKTEVEILVSDKIDFKANIPFQENNIRYAYNDKGDNRTDSLPFLP